MWHKFMLMLLLNKYNWQKLENMKNEPNNTQFLQWSDDVNLHTLPTWDHHHVPTQILYDPTLFIYIPLSKGLPTKAMVVVAILIVVVVCFLWFTFHENGITIANHDGNHPLPPSTHYSSWLIILGLVVHVHVHVASLESSNTKVQGGSWKGNWDFNTTTHCQQK